MTVMPNKIPAQAVQKPDMTQEVVIGQSVRVSSENNEQRVRHRKKRRRNDS